MSIESQYTQHSRWQYKLLAKYIVRQREQHILSIQNTSGPTDELHDVEHEQYGEFNMYIGDCVRSVWGVILAPSAPFEIILPIAETIPCMLTNVFDVYWPHITQAMSVPQHLVFVVNMYFVTCHASVELDLYRPADRYTQGRHGDHILQRIVPWQPCPQHMLACNRPATMT